VRRRISLLLLSLLSFAFSALADQVTLKNGDRLTGSIIKSDGKELVIKTDYAGEVTVKFEAIQDFKSSEDLHVGLSDGKTVVGPVTASAEKVVVTTKAGGAVEEPRASVATLRNPAEQAAYEKSMHPGLMEGWNGGLDLGFALTRGNSATKNLDIAFNATRKGAHDKLSLYERSVYSTNDATGAFPSTTANAIGGGIRYDHDFAPRWFGFVNADFFHDELQSLDLRTILGGGLGYHAIKRETTTLDLLFGGNYTHESYSAFFNPPNPPNVLVPAITRNLAGLTIGDEFMHKLGKSTVVKQNLYFFPDLTNTGEYRAVFSFGTVTKINKWFGWQNSFGDIYASDPPVGKKKNDLLFSTGLNFSFTH
jgi:putative salt-induced outer membrane protein